MPATDLPAKFTLRVKFKPDDKERVFDFTFADYSKEPGPRRACYQRGGAGAEQPTASQAAQTVRSTRRQTPATIPSPQTGDSVTFTPGTFRPEAPLPTTTQGLLQELAERAQTR